MVALVAKPDQPWIQKCRVICSWWVEARSWSWGPRRCVRLHLAWPPRLPRRAGRGGARGWRAEGVELTDSSDELGDRRGRAVGL